MSKKKVLMPYLLTGGGHLGPAKALKEALETVYPDTFECILFEGFGEENKILKSLIESGYTVVSAKALLAYITVYYISILRPVMSIEQNLIKMRTIKRFRKALEEYNPDLIVSFHPLLNGVIRQAVKDSGKNIPIYVMVLDPFTPHPAWFHYRDLKMIVYTDYLYNIAVKRYKVPPENLVKLPMILNPKYSKKLPPEELRQIKSKLGFNPENNLVLIASGGVALRNADSVVRHFLLNQNAKGIDLAVVCGRDKDMEERVRKIVNEHNKYNYNVKVFGFIDFMYELQNIADVIITKAGASGTMEALVLEKPIIISSYIWGQETGTVKFVEREKLGLHIENPKKVISKTIELLRNREMYETFVNNIKKHNFKNGYEDQSNFFYSLFTK
ncbi:MAG: glycosyltransferase [Brevinematia bacterium]